MLLLYKLNSYLIVDTATDLCSNRMIKCIGRVPHLLTDRQQTLCLLSFLWFFISSLLYFTELVLAVDPQCGNAGAFHDGFRQTEASSVHTRPNQFLHSLQEWKSLLRHLNLSFPEILTVQRNCLQRLVLIGSLRKENQTVHTTFHMESSPETVETIKSISLFLPKVHDLKQQMKW